MEDKIILLKYQSNFADNISLLAYSNIIESKSEIKCCFENKTTDRNNFESKMRHFDLDYNYTSTSKVEKMIENTLNINKLSIDRNKILHSKKIKKGIVNINHFQLDDYNLLDTDFLKHVKFNNLDFIKSYDILEEISQHNSIGLYINEKDIKNNEIDIVYIKKACKRLNKYLKKPILYIFSQEKINSLEGLDINFKYINLRDWKEEFYFLKNCKHKIILNAQNSYSSAFWAAKLNEKEYNFNIIPKSLKQKTNNLNWISI